MNLEEATKLANEAVELLKPYCDKIMIVGSIRRKRPTVNDIDLLCIPSRNKLGFGQAVGELLGLVSDGKLIKRDVSKK